MIHDKKLHEVRVHLDSITSDDIIENRKAMLNIVREGAIRGNSVCMATMWLEAQAANYGVDSTMNTKNRIIAGVAMVLLTLAYIIFCWAAYNAL